MTATVTRKFWNFPAKRGVVEIIAEESDAEAVIAALNYLMSGRITSLASSNTSMVFADSDGDLAVDYGPPTTASGDVQSTHTLRINVAGTDWDFLVRSV